MRWAGVDGSAPKENPATVAVATSWPGCASGRVSSASEARGGVAAPPRAGRSWFRWTADGLGSVLLPRRVRAAHDSGVVALLPQGEVRERAAPQLVEQAAQPGDLRVLHREPVLVLHEEQSRHRGGVDGERAPSGGDDLLEPVEARFEQLHRFRGWHGGDHREPGRERGVLRRRRRDELPGPLDQLPAAGGGDSVDGPLRPRPLPVRADGLDQSVALQALDDGVERAPLDGHVVVLALLADGRRDLVAMHGPLHEGAEHGEPQQVRYGSWHQAPPVLVCEYTRTSSGSARASRPAPGFIGGAQRANVRGGIDRGSAPRGASEPLA